MGDVPRPHGQTQTQPHGQAPPGACALIPSLVGLLLWFEPFIPFLCLEGLLQCQPLGHGGGTRGGRCLSGPQPSGTGRARAALCTGREGKSGMGEKGPLPPPHLPCPPRPRVQSLS